MSNSCWCENGIFARKKSVAFASAAPCLILLDAQRQSGTISTAAAVAQPAPAPKLDIAIGEAPLKPLKPWIEVALPHPDVLANRFKEAEFAADLFAVDAGHATEDYANSENFFRITFLTEGLKRVLTSSLQRLAGTGGDPVIGLQTSFGGGKPAPWPRACRQMHRTSPGRFYRRAPDRTAGSIVSNALAKS